MMFENQGHNFRAPEERFRIEASVRPDVDAPKLNEHSLACKECGSDEVSDNGYGYYVCRCCGLTIEDMQVFKFNTPFNEEETQNSLNPLKRSTQIGTAIERKRNPRSRELERLAKVQSITKQYEVQVLMDASAEFTRLISALKLPKKILQDCRKVFAQVRKNLTKGTKSRAPDKLAPAVLFMVLKVKAIVIDFNAFFDELKIDKEVFKEVLVKAAIHYKAYLARDKRPMILKKIQEVEEYFALGNEFVKVSCECLKNFWPYIKNTKDTVVAGVVSTLAMLFLDINKVSVSNVCEKLGIRMSTINYQVKNKIFDTMNKPGFTSLIKSQMLVKDLVMEMVLGSVKELEGSQRADETPDESEIIVINPKTGSEHHFNVGLEDFREVIPFSELNKSVKFVIFNGHSITYSQSLEYLIKKNRTKLEVGDNLGPPYKSGKGPPF